MTVDTPECDRLVAVAEESQRIGEFIDWLGEQGWFIAYTERMIDRPCASTVCTKYTVTQCVNGRSILYRGEGGEDVGPCSKCDGTGFIRSERLDPIGLPLAMSPERLLAKFYGIDLDKVEAERRAILKSLRSAS